MWYIVSKTENRKVLTMKQSETERKYSFFTTREIKPTGWLRAQLELAANGLAGNLDRVWPDVRDSAWIGGDREGWERVPYWLDGFIPLAYLLGDDDRIARARRYVDEILARQQPNGWICPTEPEKTDTWSVQLISKVLVRYYECSGDDRVPEVLRRMMKNYYDNLSAGRPVGSWGRHRWFETFPALDFLAARYDDAWIPALARLVRNLGFDYREAEPLWERPLYLWRYDTHIVNLCMMLKSEVLSRDLLGGDYRDDAGHFYDVLTRTNGTAVGTINGDECLAGKSPIAGTEFCGVVELMDSLEQIYAYTGDRKWAERLERVAFNALPATTTEDLWAHQYDQMVNQPDATPFPGKPPFTTNARDSHIFGLEPNFGCCTANHGQGWPKFALSAFLRAKDGVVCAVPLPASVTTEWRGAPVTVSCETDYPFRNTITYRTSAVVSGMKLRVRVPSFARDLTVNGAPVRNRPMLVFDVPSGAATFTISFRVAPVIDARPHHMGAVRVGSLVFSLPVAGETTPVEYEKDGVPRKFPYCDYHIKGSGDWNYALASRALTVEERPLSEHPFSKTTPALVVLADLAHVDWGLSDGYENLPAPVPAHRVPLDAPARRALVPYGCTLLRMTELPVVGK